MQVKTHTIHIYLASTFPADLGSLKAAVMRGHAEWHSIGELGSTTSRMDTVEVAGVLQASWAFELRAYLSLTSIPA
jgi:hypothetical protein